MCIFNTQDREEVLSYITSFCRSCPHILSLVLVGSGAVGYTDELSDIDLVVAIDDDRNQETVMAYVASGLKEKLQLLYFKQVSERHLQVYLCHHFLEIDIGYGAYTRAAAFRPHWKVLFDKSESVDQAMHTSWETIKSRPIEPDYIKKLTQCADTVWHNIMHASVAVKRGQYHRAAAELTEIRAMYTELLCCRHSLDAKRGRDLDLLPPEELSLLEASALSCLSKEALWHTLTELTDRLYEAFEPYSQKINLKISREKLYDYIKACRER